jgi:hypothetical protein
MRRLRARPGSASGIGAGSASGGPSFSESRSESSRLDSQQDIQALRNVQALQDIRGTTPGELVGRQAELECFDVPVQAQIEFETLRPAWSSAASAASKVIEHARPGGSALDFYIRWDIIAERR